MDNMMEALGVRTGSRIEVRFVRDAMCRRYIRLSGKESVSFLEGNRFEGTAKSFVKRRGVLIVTLDGDCWTMEVPADKVEVKAVA
jgi:hypothetical protein